MAVKIRLRREGRKKTPMYRIVIADSKAPRDGRFIEIIGQYQPQLGENAINLKTDRLEDWINVGALPTDIVAKGLITGSSVMAGTYLARLIVERLSVAAFQYLLDIVMAVSGVALLWQALR